MLILILPPEARSTAKVTAKSGRLLPVSRSVTTTDQFVADDFQRELAFLGIEPSPAFVREPDGNGCAERFIRTLKENLLWVRRFDSIEQLRQGL